MRLLDLIYTIKIDKWSLLEVGLWLILKEPAKPLKTTWEVRWSEKSENQINNNYPDYLDQFIWR